MEVPARVVLASANPKKVAELRSILDAARLATDLLERPADVAEVVEDATTFEGNARLKAVALAEATDLTALADDSGLEVDALDGAPGVHSARYAGPGASDAANVALVLAELDRVGATRAGATDRTVPLRAGAALARRRRARCRGRRGGSDRHGPRGCIGVRLRPRVRPRGRRRSHLRRDGRRREALDLAPRPGTGVPDRPAHRAESRPATAPVRPSDPAIRTLTVRRPIRSPHGSRPVAASPSARRDRAQALRRSRGRPVRLAADCRQVKRSTRQPSSTRRVLARPGRARTRRGRSGTRSHPPRSRPAGPGRRHRSGSGAPRRPPGAGARVRETGPFDQQAQQRLEVALGERESGVERWRAPDGPRVDPRATPTARSRDVERSAGRGGRAGGVSPGRSGHAARRPSGLPRGRGACGPHWSP